MFSHVFSLFFLSHFSLSFSSIIPMFLFVFFFFFNHFSIFPCLYSLLSLHSSFFSYLSPCFFNIFPHFFFNFRFFFFFDIFTFPPLIDFIFLYSYFVFIFLSELNQTFLSSASLRLYFKITFYCVAYLSSANVWQTIFVSRFLFFFFHSLAILS